MKRIVLTMTVLFCLVIVSTEVVHAEENGEKRRGLLGGLLEQVGSTVDETVNAVGGLVGSVVEGVDQTVDDTVSFTTGTLETLVDPNEKKPVSKIVENTVDHVGKTVKNVEPVLKNTTQTIDTVTTEVISVTEELPEIPVVKPVVDKVGKVVGKTTGTLTETIDNTVDETVETVQELPIIIEEVEKPIIAERKPEIPQVSEPVEHGKAPAEPANAELPVQSDMPQKVEKPVKTETIEPVEQIETERIERITENTTKQAAEQEVFDRKTEPFVEEAIAEIPNASLTQTKAPATTNVPAMKNTASMEKAKSFEPQLPMIPARMKFIWKENPVTMTTSTSSISTASVTSAGFTDFVQGVFNWLDRQALLEGRQWIHSSEIMRNQWTHAPPGQPPQQTPFLHIKINTT
ncbi:hypothetical protein QWT69_03375 [Sporosarcina oncorhynchi]|uniref:Uncharacterized protein n=1 Tax=Sporosarcina oncorhynchi TaxID=3056444 RepID=A0ABZ0L6I5_9BACL|nr:hypothetical protein [Sporosarcina sp. T2O-4]WOV88180.1 hypothetical protein QWT69_03375 [Sporosarcina sp. T2O-4]